VKIVTTVNMLEAKSSLSKLVEAVESGAEDEIVIARNGKPAAKLVPIGARQKRPVGLYDGVYPDISFEEFQKGGEELRRQFEESQIFPEEPKQGKRTHAR
jgi:prevent-host-death family protein